ncbi:MAG: hypothetical protein IPJ08_20685 [Burkholderiales bacterium]|nr:hypothetical protein [Burkholderiales bacterium]
MLTSPPPVPLPGPFAHKSQPQGVAAGPAVSRFVATQVKALLDASPAYYELPEARRNEMRAHLEKIASYAAALLQDEWATTERLGQTPLVRAQVTMPAAGPVVPSTARAMAGLGKKGPGADEFSPRAANEVARVTRDTLNAIAFPTFVADLIKGTFNAIVDASIKQMEAYGQLLANVAKTVDQFMADNISDNQARDYLVSAYPDRMKMEISEDGAKVRARDNANEGTKPDFKAQFGLPEDIELDDDSIEEKLVPAARRHLARSRHQLLSTMVLMGINRIVVTSGRIAAKMGFHIDAKDHGTALSATQFDMRNENLTSYAGGFFGYGGVAGYNKNTIAYVSSTKKDSSDALDVNADLTGEVDIKFKSDYFPMERFAKPELMAMIQGNTPNPAANTPVTGTSEKKAAAPAPAPAP